MEDTYRRLEKKIDRMYSIAYTSLVSILTLIVIELVRAGIGR